VPRTEKRLVEQFVNIVTIGRKVNNRREFPVVRNGPSEPLRPDGHSSAAFAAHSHTIVRCVRFRDRDLKGLP